MTVSPPQPLARYRPTAGGKGHPQERSVGLLAGTGPSRGSGAASAHLEGNARCEDQCSDSRNSIACQGPPRNDHSRRTVERVTPTHVPFGVVAGWCVGKPTEVGRSGGRRQRHRHAADHEPKAQDPPQLTTHPTSIGCDTAERELRGGLRPRGVDWFMVSSVIKTRPSGGVTVFRADPDRRSR